MGVFVADRHADRRNGTAGASIDHFRITGNEPVPHMTLG
jgi:hypothetical protein